MSKRLADLARRKHLLLARSRLHRLELQHEMGLLRRSFTEPKGLIGIATSAPLRPLIFGALLMLAGRGRLRGLLRGAMAALAIVNALRAR